MNHRYGVVLLSGGLDSSVTAAWAQRQYPDMDLTALTVFYGQRHDREIDAARNIALFLGIPLVVVDLSGLTEVMRHSALTNPLALDVPQSGEVAKDIPVTYVPIRNTILVSTAFSFVESRALREIEACKLNPKTVNMTVFVGANILDYSGYPDCRPKFFARLVDAIKLGSKAGSDGVAIEIETPIIGLSKKQIVEMAMKLGVPVWKTWSCYVGGDRPCGRCDSCVIRAQAFEEARVQDAPA